MGVAMNAQLEREESKREWLPIKENIKEYTTIKHVLDGNTQMVRLNDRRIKSIDCKVMSVLIQDAVR